MNQNLFKTGFFKICLVLAIMISGITAYNSIGFYHADEHYQIIEFANARLGNSPLNELPWEFKAKVRPTFQVGIAMIFLYAFDLFGIENPFTRMVVIRIFLGIFSIVVISLFVKNTIKLFDKIEYQRIYLVLSYFLWFIPFLSVRFSSEILSGLFFLLGLSILLSKKVRVKNWFLLGVFFGISFVVRSQMAFALFGVFLWILFILKQRKKLLLSLLLGFVAVIFFGFLIDVWFYSELTFTSYNYFYENIINKRTLNYGTSPWYFYFESIVNSPTIIFGIPIIASLFYFFVKNPKSIFTWIVFAFLLFHSCFAHKEERFLFPIVYLVPLFITSFYAYLNIKNQSLKTVLCLLIISFNFPLLIFVSQFPNDRGRLVLAKYIYENIDTEKQQIVHTNNGYLYEDVRGSLKMNFYKPKHIAVQQIQSLKELDSYIKHQKEVIVIAQKKEFDSFENNQLNKIEFLKESLPIKKKWMDYIEDLGFKLPNSNKILYLFKLKS